MKTAVSFLKTDDYKKCIKKIDESICDYIHVDFCDGKYVRSKNLTIGQTTKLLKNANKPLNVHLMCKEPIKYVDDFALLNTESITIHPLACTNVKETIEYIKNMGIKVGIAINPNEKINLIEEYLGDIDEVLVMSVTPGKGGQEFRESILPKLDKIIELKSKYHYTVAIDGGINADTINFIKDKDIDIIISGSYITSTEEDYDEKIKALFL